MLRASECLREGPSAGFWIWEGCCVFAERQDGVLRVRLAAVSSRLSLAAIRP
mgnify:CR=1 FL=1